MSEEESLEKFSICGLSHSTVRGWGVTLYVADPGSVPSILYSPWSTPGLMPKCRARSQPGKKDSHFLSVPDTASPNHVR